jgi:hypothetical protein
MVAGPMMRIPDKDALYALDGHTLSELYKIALKMLAYHHEKWDIDERRDTASRLRDLLDKIDRQSDAK